MKSIYKMLLDFLIYIKLIKIKYFYHGTHEENKQIIIADGVLVPHNSHYGQSENNYVYLCQDSCFSQTICYALDKNFSYTFVEIGIVGCSKLYKHLETNVKNSNFGSLTEVKHKGIIAFSRRSVYSAKIVTLDNKNPKYKDFFNLITNYPPNYVDAKKIIDGLEWKILK